MPNSASPLVAPRPDAVGHAPHSLSASLFPSLFVIAGQALQPGREARQLISVIHQIHWSEKARAKLLADPDAFIMGLKVLPQVKVVLSMMRATLLAGRVVTPEFSWWWGVTDPGPQTDDGDDPTAGGTPLPTVARPEALSSLVV
jgi:hypothetical protein